MTLDVTIGYVEPNTEPYDDQIHPSFDVIQCPNADHDVCNPEYTMDAKESYRSGSFGEDGFWAFWKRKSLKLSAIYFEMRENPDSNDRDVAYLKPFIERINAIPESDFTEAVDLDRLKWLKYWVNKAIELYGDKAGIMFS